MGTRMAPPNAILFMGRVGAKIMEQFPQSILFYKRFIDDILKIFHGSVDEFDKVFFFINNMHPTINFTFNQFSSSINFIDVKIYKDKNGGIQTTTHRKSTDTMSLFHYDSNHSDHLKNSIIYSQALRYNRVISDRESLIKELEILSRTLVLRIYPFHAINKYISKALRWTQHDLINKIRTPKRDRMLSMVTVHTNIGKSINRIIRKHWNIIKQETHLRNIWPTPPVTTYMKTTSIRDSLVHTAHKKSIIIPYEP